MDYLREDRIELNEKKLVCKLKMEEFLSLKERQIEGKNFLRKP